MKKRFLSMLLLMLMGMAGNLTAMAQMPEPSGQWKFDNPSDLMAATAGDVTLMPAVLGNKSISVSTVAEAGITAAEGPNGSSAIFVPAASALKVQRAEGAAASTNFSFMLDMKVLNAFGYDGLFQTNGGNSNDGDLFISKSQIGLGGYLGGYYGCIWNDSWYRIIMTNSNGSVKVYINGEKVIDYATTDGRFEIDPAFYLLADEDGEKQDTYVSEVAFWETPLTEEQAIALGSIDNSPWITDASQIKEGDQFYIISARAKFNGTKTAKPKAMSTYQTSYTTSNWGEQYVYWGDLNKESDAYVWTAEKVGDQWAFLNKENGKYIGNMNTNPEEPDVVFSDTPVGYTLTDLAEGAGRFYMTNEESEHSLHVQGYLRGDRESNSLSKQNVGDDDYADADVARNGYPGRWRLLKLNAEEPDTRTKIATAEDLAAFAQAVSEGNTTLEAVLTADIDLSTSEYPDLMIGTDANKFAGTFDGAEHTIKYKYKGECVAEKWRGLFRAVEGATIRNLRVEGEAYPTNIHFGALIGVAYGTVLVENVVTDVDITGTSTTGVQGDAGMLGANYANITFNNCAVLGPMGSPGSSMYSPFSGWSNGSSSVTLNNCYAACYFKEGTGIDGNSATLTHGGTSANYFNNCYYLNYIDKVQGTQVTAEQIASGELCFKLNGDQSTIGWYQNLDGTDAFPVPFASHSKVYANGTLRCDGAELPDAPITYGNTEGQTTIPDHQYGDDGICTVCGSPTQNADGYYLIDTAQKLNWFATKTSEGTTNLNVLLTADIDLSTSDYPDLMIGTETAEYAGIFNGDGHAITYNYALVADKWRGLFAFVNGATIRNLYVEGSAVVTNIHYGALIGRAYGTVLVENVITNVDITGQRSGVTGDGGMLGANYANITFNNCATLGAMGYEGSSMYSSFSAWSNSSSSTTLNNCYSLCTLKEGTGTGNCFTLTHKGGTNTINNSYYLNLLGDYVGGTQVTEEEVANGALCYKLGDGFGQYLGVDAYPTPLGDLTPVSYVGETGYATMFDTTTGYVLNGDVKPYTAFLKNTWLELLGIEFVPVGTPVVLKGTYYNKLAQDLPAINIANDLQGTDADTEADGTMYVLAEVDGKVGFYKASKGTTIAAGKAYYQSANAQVKAYNFVSDDATGINEVNGQWSMVNGQSIYNLAGQRVNRMQKGINIVNGKKILK